MTLEISTVEKDSNGWIIIGQTQTIHQGFQSAHELNRKNLYIGPDTNPIALGDIFEYVSDRPDGPSSFSLRSNILYQIDGTDIIINSRNDVVVNRGSFVFDWQGKNIRVRKIS